VTIDLVFQDQYCLGYRRPPGVRARWSVRSAE
jgi:hypothetical protein